MVVIVNRTLHRDEVTDISDLEVGKRIRCHYQATPNAVGTFSNLGEETSNFIPVSSASATPNGDFYFIMVENWNNKKILVADRNIQQSISWDVLNTAGIASGSGLPLSFRKSDFFSGSNTSPKGHVVRASEVLTIFEPYRAFDNSTVSGNCWAMSPNKSGWLEYTFPEPEIINEYRMFANSTLYTQAPYSWVFEGSNDNGSSWTQLDNRKNISGWSANGLSFKVNNSVAYSKYRINVSQFNGASDASSIGELQLLGAEKDSISTIRLLTGGISATDTDNEWYKYIVNSTLNGTITAGDKDVWNWGGIYSATSTTSTSSTRVIRGSSVAGSSNNNTNNTTSTWTGFRPVLEIENLPVSKSFILHDGEYKEFSNEIVSLVPILSENTGDNGKANSNNGSENAYRAFDGDDLTYYNAGTSIPYYISYEFNEIQSVSSYEIMSYGHWLSNNSASIKSWTFEGSNNGTIWDILDTQTGYVFDDKIHVFNLKKEVNYKHYKINVTEKNSTTSFTTSVINTLRLISVKPPMWKHVTSKTPTLAQFIENSLDDLSVLDRNSTTFDYKMVDNGVLGDGKLFKQTIDLKKFIEIESIGLK